MNNDKIIRTIPKRNLVNDYGQIKKKKVCIYARVSTEKELQKTSFELQISTYHKQITSNPLWEFAGVFADYGKSGTNIEHRKEFNKMIELARLGHIDIILTKSVSRFSRDIVDGLSLIQELRLLGVEVYFEKENISTLDQVFDFFLSVYTSVAEEEAKINSDNVLWTYKKKMEKGKNTTSTLYGYKFDKEGNYLIYEPEAKAVRLIFDLYLKGRTLNEIIYELKEQGFKTKTGKDKFSASTIKGILRNEKYCGDMLLQKTTVTKVGSRKSLPNTSKTKYYIENNHEGIIDKETFNKVKEIISKRKEIYHPNNRPKPINKYSSYVYSVITKKFYQSKVNHKNTKYEVKLLEMVDKNYNRILDVKNIYYSQIDMLLSEAAKVVLKDLKNIKEKINNELLNKIKTNNIDENIGDLELVILNLKSKINNIKTLNIDEMAKKELINKLDEDLEKSNHELIKLKYEKLMRYTYNKNIPILEQKIKKLQKNDNFDLKEIFNYVIAVDRENLILCIHLSNRNIRDINLIEEYKNLSIYNGDFIFTQTRLTLNVNWKVIII